MKRSNDFITDNISVLADQILNSNDPEVIGTALAQGNIDADSTLEWACGRGSSAVVKLAVNYGASVHGALEWAIKNNKPDVLAYTILTKPDNSLMWAINKGYPAVVKVALEYKASVNTALSLGLFKGNAAIVQIALENEKAKFVPSLHDIGTMSKMIFPYYEENTSNNKKYIASSSGDKIKAIYNHEKYSIPSIDGAIKGNPLSVKSLSGEELPIAYSIYLPQSGDITATLVNVYGGGRIQTLNRWHKYLITQHNIALVLLDLVDLLKLGNCPQNEMPKELFDSVQLSINAFYKALKTNKLHPELLSNLINTKTFLIGESFGAMVVLDYQKSYPHTYDGSIVVSLAHLTDKTDKIGFAPSKLRLFKNYLEPKTVSEDTLFIHNHNDHNTYIKGTTLFYQNLPEESKKKVQLFFNKKGGGNATILDKSKYAYIGHFISSDEETLQAIVDFIKGKRESHNITEWKAYKNDILANFYYQNATDEEKFVSYIHRTLKGDYKTMTEEKLEPIYKALAFANMINTTPELLKVEIEYISKLPDVFFENAARFIYQDIEEYLSLFLDPAGSKVDFGKIIDLDSTSKKYEKMIEEGLDYRSKVYLLQNLYLANPDLFNIIENEHYNNPKISSGFNEAWASLIATYDKELDLRKGILQETVEVPSDVVITGEDGIPH